MHVLGDGHMFYMVRNGGSGQATAILSTPYKRTDDMCIELYYWGFGGYSLLVQKRGEDFKWQTIESGVRIHIAERVRGKRSALPLIFINRNTFHTENLHKCFPTYKISVHGLPIFYPNQWLHHCVTTVQYLHWAVTDLQCYIRLPQ